MILPDREGQDAFGPRLRRVDKQILSVKAGTNINTSDLMECPLVE